MASELYYLWINDQQAGPYTLGQLKSMWASGSINAETKYWIEGNEDWSPLLTISESLEQNVENPSVNTIQADSQEALQLKMMEIQSKMKSPVTAALLAIFIPFVGGCYGSEYALMPPTIAFIIGAVLSYIMETPALILIFLSISYVPSIFVAVNGVAKYNNKLLKRAKTSS